MQERQIGATRERERIARPRQQRTSETADNPPFSLYEVRTLNTSRICHSPAHARYAKLASFGALHLHDYHHSLFRCLVSEFGGATILHPLIPLAESWQIRVARTTKHSTGAYHAAQAYSEPQDTTRPSPLLAIVLVDFISSHHSLLAFDWSLGTVNNKPRSIPPSPHCTTTSSPNRPRTHRSLCTAIV
jgi:hypothetical protein